MRLLQTALMACLLVGLCLAKDATKNRGKRQQLIAQPRRTGKPPPYAVPMEPLVQYSQRDPLYGPLPASAKSDDTVYDDASPYGYYPSEPEPIIEIIIKESNESLPAPITPAPRPRPTKEPIQVFYVKYEKKKSYGDKTHVVYDPPVPALTPIEDHEEILPEGHSPSTGYGPPESNPVTLAPEPSTTLRAIIRPDSEVYHSGSSGIRVTFGTEQLPANSHYKRSDQFNNTRNGSLSDTVNSITALPTPLPAPESSKRPHGPYQPQQPIPPRIQPAFPQQRIVNSFPQQYQQQLQQQQQPQLQQNFYAQQLPFQNQPPPLLLRNPVNRPPQRHPINVQGLPEVQQRQQFNTYVVPPRGNQPQHPLPNQQQQNFSPPSTLIQNPSLPNEAQHFPHRNLNFQQQPLAPQPPQHLEKQRYQDQRLKQQTDQQRLLEQQQRYYEQRLQEQKRKQQELEQQQLQYRQQLQKYNPGQLLHHTQQSSYQHQQQVKATGEIFKAIPKLEQHIAIRENPHQPGPFPQTPATYKSQQDQVPQFGAKTNTQKYYSPLQQQIPKTTNNNPKPQQTPYKSYYSQNLFGESGRLPQSTFLWPRPNQNGGNDKIYATPVSTSESYTPTTQKPVVNYKPYSTTSKPPLSSTTALSTTTTPSTTTTTLNPQKEAKIKQNIANLPAEVPDDIREQLLSSGILGNADIQILDYDKIGDTPIENLPPEALANFYGAGGGSVSLASEPIPSLAKKPKEAYYPKKVSAADVEPATLRPGGVEMKVVRFDPNTAQGQSLADKHIRDDATRLGPVNIGSRDESQYNRYLPLKVSGASFPIPDVPELEGKRISSVVVLAPIDYSYQDDVFSDNEALERQGRKIGDVQSIRFLAGDSLKQLVKKPSAENYKKWLEQEKHTEPQRQSVVLLVTTSKDGNHDEKEIFMYDITSQTVSKLSGDLSSAFVDAAESNTDGSKQIDDSV